MAEFNHILTDLPPGDFDGEVVLYQPNNNIRLEVQLDKNTVWLSQAQICQLFGKVKSTISYHISNIFKEKELDPKVAVRKIRTTTQHGAISGKTQSDELLIYNLDVIISVGYRVHSPQGTRFRIWATNVLRDYLLRGYAVNQQLLHLEQRIDSRLQEHTEQIHDLQNKVDFFVRTALPPVEQVFFEGEFFEARVLLEKIIKTAMKRVIIIDAYVDATTFDILDVRAKGVTADIYSDGEYKSLRDMHNLSKGKQPVNTHKWSTASHDRWLIVDEILYHCGHSLKDMGRKLSAITRMGTNPEDILKQVK